MRNHFTNIPIQLQSHPHWVCWQGEPRGDKITKRPINPRTGALASVTEPEDWASFQEALDAALKRGLSGIGLVLTEGCGLIGIDLDDAFAPDGQLHPWAKKLVRTLNSYSEISPSGRGIRIFIKGALPGTRCRKGKVEMYARGRFLTVTGNRLSELDGTPLPSTVEERQVEIEAVHREIFPDDHTARPAPSAKAEPMDLSDAEVIAKAMSAGHGAGDRFRQLWQGDWQGVGFKSQSEGDACLLGSLRFYTQADQARCFRLFAQSGLNREKWSRPDYRAKTWSLIDHGDVYRPSASRPGKPPSPAPAGKGEQPRPGAQASSALTVDDLLDRVRDNQDRPPEFPLDAMPPGLRELVEQSSTALGVDPALVAVPALTAAGIAIGATRCAMPKKGFLNFPVLWTMIISNSGTLKTPALEAALCGLHRQEQKAHFRYRKELEKYERLKKEHELALRQGKEVDPLPDEPQPVRHVVRDITFEKLCVVLHANPRGVLAERDELSSLVGGMGKYSGDADSETPQWLELYQGGKVTVDRKGGDRKPLHIDRALVAITGGIQPGTLKRCMGPKNFENGFMARFLMVMPEPRPRKWSEAVVDDETRADAAELFRRLVAIPLRMDEEGQVDPVCVPFTPEAKAAYVVWYEANGLEIAGLGDERLQSAWSKMESSVVRIALIHATVREVQNPNPSAPVIDLEAVEAAIRLITYFKAHTRRVYALFAQSDADNLLRRLMLFFVEHPGEAFTARDLAKGPPYIAVAKSKDMLALLTAAGFLVAEDCPAKGGKGGRSCLRYQLSEEGREKGQCLRLAPAPSTQPLLPATDGNPTENPAEPEQTDNRGIGEPSGDTEEFREEL